MVNNPGHNPWVTECGICTAIMLGRAAVVGGSNAHLRASVRAAGESPEGRHDKNALACVEIILTSLSI